MKKFLINIFGLSFLLLISFIIYLSSVGIKTDKFNNQISNQINSIDKNLKIELKKINILLDPFKFKIYLKAVDVKLTYKDKTVQLEKIKSSISLKALINDRFLLSNLNISTKSLKIQNVISFVRNYNNDAKLYIAEKLVNDGYIISYIDIEFDKTGNIKNNYIIKGLVKDGEINLLKKYQIAKLDFLFEIKQNVFNFKDVKFNLNGNKLSLPSLDLKKEKNKFYVFGNAKNENFISNKLINEIIDLSFLNLKIKKVNFDTENSFNFEIDRKFKIEKLDVKSKIFLKNLSFSHKINLKKILPNFNQQILLNDHLIDLNYKKNSLSINGSGNLLIQKENDKIEYNILKTKNEFDLDINLEIIKNIFELDLINYKKKENSTLRIGVKAKKVFDGNLNLKQIILKEDDNNINISNLLLDKKNKVVSVNKINLDYLDTDNLENKIQITKKDKDYLLEGETFNINKIIENLLEVKKSSKREIFKNKFELRINLKEAFLDKTNFIKNLKGYVFFKNNAVSEANLKAFFIDKKKIAFSLQSKGNEKITTLYTDYPKPLVKRYKFIKGFEEGTLDFYSIKKNGKSNSTLIIDNFKIQEVPVLAKLLTLASLQGIADLLTGEGIRFTDFEMKFSNNNELIKIEEMYAIGPAISILMEGYIQNKGLISLRGTLVPATTINRTISSIPFIGDILVGKKTGEGVFGVSFKIKGPPKKLKTSVNPIKTLTPRFITRTIEKIKKN